MRIGFLFNHSGGHQVAHSLPVALALRRLSNRAEVRIFVSRGTEGEVTRLLDREAGPRPDVVRLAPPSRLASTAKRVTGGAVPADNLSVLRRNLAHFRDLDALVVPEKTSLMLKTHFGLDNLRMIHTRHGAGDRAIGFDKASGGFDLVLMSGQKIRDRLSDSGLLRENGHAIVGYPKFDLPPRSPRPRLFPKDRPTVLYNPHPSPALSSWHRMGPQILDWFAKSDRYNLIFAPHVMLFQKSVTASLSPFALGWNRLPDARHYDRDHMLIDTGSPASLDMTYTDAADIYLGDASSQLYEFIRRPRPCVFLNPRGHAWRGNPDFAHWQAGPVVETFEDFEAAFEDVPMLDPADRQRQRDLFAYSFDLDARPSSERAAEAILDYMGRA